MNIYIMSKYTLWGPATWYLFHTLAEKIKPQEFHKLKNELIMLIKNICSGLPCPDCALHSSQILAGYKSYHLLQSKDDFKRFVFEFHNIVNNKAKNEVFNKDILEKYKTGNLSKIFQYWYQTFSVKGSLSNTLMINSINRDNIRVNVQKFFQTNQNSFEL